MRGPFARLARRWPAVLAPALVSAPLLADAPVPGPSYAGGTLRICASDLTDFDDTTALSLPAGVVFTEWGPVAGDLRAVRLDPDYPPARASGQAAVVTEGAVTLDASAPCADVAARAVVSPEHGWRAASVPAGHSVFLASDVLGPHGPDAGEAGDRALYAVLTMNVLAARPLTAIGDAETVP